MRTVKEIRRGAFVAAVEEAIDNCVGAGLFFTGRELRRVREAAATLKRYPFNVWWDPKTGCRCVVGEAYQLGLRRPAHRILSESVIELGEEIDRTLTEGREDLTALRVRDR